jgi:hypothetical protein
MNLARLEYDSGKSTSSRPSPEGPMQAAPAAKSPVPLLVVALGAGLALACRAAGAWLAPPPTPTPTVEILADCFWSADAFAWVDANGNGAPDDGEPPLPGVDVNFTLTFLSGGTTGPDGTAHVGGMHPGECNPALANRLVAVAPAGYVPTTDLAVPYTPERARYEFGFQPGP